MKILILANNDVGLYNFRHELIEALIQKNEIHIALPYGPKVELLKKQGCIYHDIYLQRRKKNPFMDLVLLRQIKKLSTEIKPDFLITYTIKPNIYGGMVGRWLGIPYFTNITGLGTAFQNEGLLRKFVTTLYKVSLREAQTVFFENSENMNIFRELRIVDKQNTFLLNGAGVNTDHYSYLPYPRSFSEQPVRFLFVGRVMKEKGIDELFEAISMLKEKGHNLILDVVGDCEENYEATLEEYQSNGLIHYHGFQEDVLPFIQDCSCLILPSWHEGMANTILEAASCGRPVIASNISGCKESVEHGKTGYLCRARSSDDLAEKMICFLQLSDQQRAEMGKLGREKMLREFNKEIVVQQTMRQIGNILGKEI